MVVDQRVIDQPVNVTLIRDRVAVRAQETALMTSNISRNASFYHRQNRMAGGRVQGSTCLYRFIIF